jgi:hypothetical protein
MRRVLTSKPPGCGSSALEEKRLFALHGKEW